MIRYDTTHPANTTFELPTSRFDSNMHPRRRRLLDHLDDRSTPATVDELVDLLSDTERPTEPSSDGGERRKADDSIEGGDRDAVDRRHCLIRLHHVDLPLLADAGLIEYDPDENRVEIVR